MRSSKIAVSRELLMISCFFFWLCYIDGPSLRDYLQEQGTIAESITRQIVIMKGYVKVLG
ncbi:MAG: hypothetical protein ACXVNF_15680 [Neobacillus sp.]